MYGVVQCNWCNIEMYGVAVSHDPTNQILTLIETLFGGLLTNSVDSLIGAAGYLVRSSYVCCRQVYTYAQQTGIDLYLN